MEVPGPSGAAESSAPCRDAPHSAAAQCGRRWSARQRRCSGSARTPPRAWVCSGPSRHVATSLPASCGARTPESTPECGPGLAPPSDATPVAGATRLSGSGTQPPLPSIAWRPSKDPRPSSPRHCFAGDSSPHDASPTPAPTVSATRSPQRAPIRYDRPGPRRAAQRGVFLPSSRPIRRSITPRSQRFCSHLRTIACRPFSMRCSNRSRIARSFAAQVGAAAAEERLRPGFIRHSPHLQAFADLVPGSLEQLLLEPLQLPRGRSHDGTRASLLEPLEVGRVDHPTVDRPDSDPRGRTALPCA